VLNLGVVIGLIIGLKRQESGQSLVEFALVLPLFILLFFGLIEMSILGFSYISVNNAARTGVRVASVGGSEVAIRKAIDDLIILNRSSLIVDISRSVLDSGPEVTVNISYQVPLIVPNVGGIFPNPFIINTSLSMRLE